MRTSTFALSTEQQWIFILVIALAVLFAGCTDSPSGPVITGPATSTLEGSWEEMPNGKVIDNPASLDLSQTQGIYQATSDDGSSSNILMMFKYEKINSNVLRVTMERHQINGVDQPVGGAEDVFYSLYDNNLRIFNKTFARQ